MNTTQRYVIYILFGLILSGASVASLLMGLEDVLSRVAEFNMLFIFLFFLIEGGALVSKFIPDEEEEDADERKRNN